MIFIGKGILFNGANNLDYAIGKNIKKGEVKHSREININDPYYANKYRIIQDNDGMSEYISFTKRMERFSGLILEITYSNGAVTIHEIISDKDLRLVDVNTLNVQKEKYQSDFEWIHETFLSTSEP
jgi:hypothetical protein